MEVFIERACGIDVHQKMLVACVLIEERGKKKPRKIVRKFRTVTKELEQFRDWLLHEGVTHAAMEGTGVYWKPVYNVLEGAVDITIGNARHLAKVPGRKTDVTDSEWIALLLRMGLIQKSFVPSKPVRELRDLTRFRRGLVQDRTTARNRVSKLLESCNVKLSGIVSDVFGKSGMAMLHALAEGKLSIAAMAGLAKGRMRSKIPDLLLALEGRVLPHHRTMLRLQLDILASHDERIAQVEALLAEKVRPYEMQIRLLSTIPGIDRIAAIEILGEIGPDVAAFTTAGHLAAWAGVCPGNHLSAGKSKGGRARRGNPYLQSILVEAALGASRTKRSYLKDKHRRLKARRGAGRANFAIAHKILCGVHRVMSTGERYLDLGDTYLARRNKKGSINHHVRSLAKLGVHIDKMSIVDEAGANLPAPN
jgi:transposase